MTLRASLKAHLTAAGIRATCPRLAVAEALWSGTGTRHVEASSLHGEIAAAGQGISLATVYNSLREFERGGLVRRVAVSSDRTWFDTDTGNHQHFHVEAEDRMFDVPGDWRLDIDVPIPPHGYRVTKVDIVIHLEPVSSVAK